MRQAYKDKLTKTIDMRTAKIISNYASKVVKKGTKHLTNEEKAEIGKVFNTPNPQIAAARTQQAINAHRREADQAIIDALVRNNISADKPFELLADAEKIAKETKKSKDLIAIADRYLDLHKLKPSKVIQSIQSELNQTTDYTEFAPESAKKVKLRLVSKGYADDLPATDAQP